MNRQSWLRGALTDEVGHWDVAYISLFAVMLALVGAVPFMCAMSAIGYFRCVELLTAVPPILCRYDPAPLGSAVQSGMVGFATALAALAGYMAATRKSPPPPQTVTTATATVETTATPS